MSGAASEVEAGRARPASGGLWSLISWLRREDSASSDSLSSVGSDRTVASFAFLAPDTYLRPAPVFRPPPGPPTDSYKKRLRDRHHRLQHDRDLTLHRKYGLFREGYDAFSLPPARKSSESWEERDRRATSECLQRRAAHVPGKRRAPPPPARSATLGAPRRSRKRPAPQPPRRPLSEYGRHSAIPEEPLLLQTPLRSTESMDCKPEKHIKKETKDPPRREKSFLKQIFESRKRYSAVDPVPERILPSISELDKQAAEIIESCKLKAFDRSNERTGKSPRELVTPCRGDMWFCTRCLRKYDDTVVTCGHCITEQKMKINKNDSDRRLASRASSHYTQTDEASVASTSGVKKVEEKQKLKDMLKEIKDSLPKRPKQESIPSTKDNQNAYEIVGEYPSVVEAPTLRIGSKMCEEEKPLQAADKMDLNMKTKSIQNHVKVVADTASTSATETAVVTQAIVLQHVPSRDIIKLEHVTIPNSKQGKISTNSGDIFNYKLFIPSSNAIEKDSIVHKNVKNTISATSCSTPINVPLKISSLLNSSSISEQEVQKNSFGSSHSSQHHQPHTQTTIPASVAKPSVSSSLSQTAARFNSGVRGMNSACSVLTAASKEDSKTTSQEKPTQKALKATSTTQTSSNRVLDIGAGSKQNIKSIKDQPVQIKPSNLAPIPESKNVSPKVSLCGTQTSTISSAPDPAVYYNKGTHKDENRNQQQKFSFLDEPCKVSAGGVLKLDIPRGPDQHQHNSAVKGVPLELHTRRRNLINQLEQSIAKGDERAAADAAAKLAQLRLSCSVLSFSSQIVGAPSTSSDAVKKTSEFVSKVQIEPLSNNLAAQTKSSDKLQNTPNVVGIAASSSKTPTEKKNTGPQKFGEPSTSPNKKIDAAGKDDVSIEVWIEDKEAARGPIRMNMPRVSVMGDLRRQASASFGLAAHLQRWIVGKTLCTDDKTPLNSLAGPEFDAPFYLCLVEPETNKLTASRPGSSSASRAENTNLNVKQTNGENKPTDVYAELVLLERRALVPNAEEFECGVCMENYQPGQGAVLRECIHTFCNECLSDVVKHSEEPAVSCPAMGCPGFLQEREIRALVTPEEYERWLARGLAAAESGTRNAFHCRTRDCKGWALCEPGVTRFPCPVCKKSNCVSCQAIHEGDTCEQYSAKKRASEAANRAPEETDEGTKAFLATLISRGEALECPECSAIITKKWGCDWIKCSACKTEICWVTRGRRWGPGGRGDTSAGCRCGVDGKRCHSSCGYCH